MASLTCTHLTSPTLGTLAHHHASILHSIRCFVSVRTNALRVQHHAWPSAVQHT